MCKLKKRVYFVNFCKPENVFKNLQNETEHKLKDTDAFDNRDINEVGQ